MFELECLQTTFTIEDYLFDHGVPLFASIDSIVGSIVKHGRIGLVRRAIQGARKLQRLPFGRYLKVRQRARN